MEVDEDSLQESTQQLCRLCGQYESMYVDVFGDEGTKRLLNLKIHSKINILIDERDPLPKAICVQCLGKLEFVCDFQEECNRTQRALRDQYNLPPLSDVINQEEKKLADCEPSTSSSRANKSNAEIILPDANVDAALNPANTDGDIVVHRASPIINPLDNGLVVLNNNDSAKNFNKTTSVLRRFRGGPRQTSTPINNTGVQSKIRVKKISVLSEKNNLVPEENLGSCAKKITPRRLRSRPSVELKNPVVVLPPIAKRLRSRSSTTSSKASEESFEKKDEDLIQIPTKTLNKVLSAITNSPDVGVAVKESTSKRPGDLEDISFTVELSSSKNDPITVVAKVFPDQDQCLVDKTIVSFLEDGTNQQVNNLVNNIVSEAPRQGRSKKECLIDKLQNSEDITYDPRSPGELYKMDGKEISVEDKLEQVHVNDVLNYACKICRKVYERKDKCTVHVKTHLNIKQYLCILCPARFVCKSDVMKHIRCSHTNPRPVACPKCPKRFRSKFDLEEHNNVHKGLKPYQCAHCDQSYHHKVSLQMHMKSHMPPQNLSCSYCGKVFPYRTRLLSHIGSVHLKERRSFRCRFCYNLYSSLVVLNEHVKTRHTTTYVCETCGKTFKVASKYKAHMTQHTNPKPFACNVCNNKYASKAFLNEHLLKHQGLRKHVCPTCQASFAQASHLAAHRHVHEEKTHACPVCNKKFNRRDNMKVHMKRHQNSRGKLSSSMMMDKDATSDENNLDSSNGN